MDEADERPEPEGNLQAVYDRASEEEKNRYLELMRHDPITGTVYLEALALRQRDST